MGHARSQKEKPIYVGESQPTSTAPFSTEDLDKEMDMLFERMKGLDNDKEKTDLADRHLEQAAKHARSQETEAPGGGWTKEEAKLAGFCEEALQAGDFDLRGALGNRFYKDHKQPGTEAQRLYKQQHTKSDKQQYRMKWLATTLSTLKQKKTFHQTWSQVDETQGQYLPYTRIVQEEGSDDAARRAAALYCSKAAKMGGRWTAFNEMTERT